MLKVFYNEARMPEFSVARNGPYKNIGIEIMTARGDNGEPCVDLTGITSQNSAVTGFIRIHASTLLELIEYVKAHQQDIVQEL